MKFDFNNLSGGFFKPKNTSNTQSDEERVY